MNSSAVVESKPDQEWAPTRHSLVNRLRDLDDNASWQEFFDLYWKLIYGTAIKAGLSDQEAEDVVQETVISVAKKMDSFRYDPAVCSFKGWLLHVTRWRIVDQLRKRQPFEQNRVISDTSTSGTSLMNRLPGPDGLGLEMIWDEEWQKNLVDVAMERIKQRIKPQNYQIFYLHAVKNYSVLEVARMLGINVARVYLTKHRVAGMIKKEMATIESHRL